MWPPIYKFSVVFRCHYYGVGDLNYITKRPPAGIPDMEHIFINKNCAIGTKLLIAARFHCAISLLILSGQMMEN